MLKMIGCVLIIGCVAVSSFAGEITLRGFYNGGYNERYNDRYVNLFENGTWEFAHKSSSDIGSYINPVAFDVIVYQQADTALNDHNYSIEPHITAVVSFENVGNQNIVAISYTADLMNSFQDKVIREEDVLNRVEFFLLEENGEAQLVVHFPLRPEYVDIEKQASQGLLIPRIQVNEITMESGEFIQFDSGSALNINEFGLRVNVEHAWPNSDNYAQIYPDGTWQWNPGTPSEPFEIPIALASVRFSAAASSFAARDSTYVSLAHIAVTPVFRNLTDQVIHAIECAIRIFDADRTFIWSSGAVVFQQIIGPGEAAEFSVFADIAQACDFSRIVDRVAHHGALCLVEVSRIAYSDGTIEDYSYDKVLAAHIDVRGPGDTETE